MAYAVAADITGDGGEFTLPTGWDASDSTAAIAVAQERIDAVTRDHWESTALSFLLSGDGTTMLELKSGTHWPCLSITQVQYREDFDSTDNFDADGEVVDVENYYLSKSRRSIIRSPNTTDLWEGGHLNYKVTGNFGRTNTPLNIKRACVLLAREHMSPGYLVEFAVPYSEWFPDGYRYIAQLPSKSLQTPHTGHQIVDVLLESYIRKIPMMVVP